MSRRNPIHPEYEPWKIDREEHEHPDYVGVMDEGEPIFDNPDKGSVFEGKAHAEDKRITPGEGTEESLGGEETVGRTIERLGDAVGWDGLSKFAQKHHEDEDSKAGSTENENENDTGREDR